MRFYSMSYRELMELPISVFWTLSHNVERIRAEEDLRQFRVLQNSQAGEEAKDFIESMQEAVGKVLVIDPIQAAIRDEQGLAELRGMAMQMIG